MDAVEDLQVAELVALADGYRESTDSWADLLRDLRSRGMRAPVLAVGDGALGFWAALRDVWPETRTQRCWVHKVANVLAALPQSAHRTARRMLAEIRDAEDRDRALRAVHAFAHHFGGKWPKAVARSTTSKRCSRSTTSRPSTGSTSRPRMKSSTVGGRSLGVPVGDEHFVGPFLLLDQRLLGVA